MPELDAALPKQTRIRAWESAPDLTARPNREDLPPVPDRIHRRWDRFVRLMGHEGVLRLLSSHVTIFGLGGVGSYVAEALARSAVGRLTLVDFDDVCLTNVNRQLQAFPGTVGQSKAALLAERVRAIHPEAWVDPVQAFYDASTSAALLTPRPDFVVDAIDNVTSKVLLLETCLTQGIPVISITGAGARLDPTQIRVDDLSRTKVDPLARVLRKELRLPAPNLRFVLDSAFYAAAMRIGVQNDLIMSATAMHHVKDTYNMIQKFADHLKPGGHTARADLDSEDGGFHAIRPWGVFRRRFDRNVPVTTVA